MNKKTKITITSVAVLLSLCLLGFSGILAWFSLRDSIGTFAFKIAKINSTVTLYYGVDENYNGIPELLETPITAGSPYYTYYEDKYNFYEPVTQFGGEVSAVDYALNEEPVEISLNIAVTSAFPSRIYTYKLSMQNKGEASNTISMRISEGTFSDTDADLMSTLSVRVGLISHTDGTISFGEKTYLFSGMSGNNFSENAFLSGIEIAGIIEAGDSGSNYLDYWLQIEMEPYETLSAEFGENWTMTTAEYNALQNKTLTLPVMRIYFEVVS